MCADGVVWRGEREEKEVVVVVVAVRRCEVRERGLWCSAAWEMGAV